MFFPSCEEGCIFSAVAEQHDLYKRSWSETSNWWFFLALIVFTHNANAFQLILPSQRAFTPLRRIIPPTCIHQHDALTACEPKRALSGLLGAIFKAISLIVSVFVFGVSCLCPSSAGKRGRRETRQGRKGQQVGSLNTEPETRSDTLCCLPPRDSGATVCLIRTW